MWVSKKRYNIVLEALGREACAREAAEEIEKRWRDIAISCQKDNKRLVAHEEEMLAKMKELEAKLAFAIQQRDYYYNLLENASEVEEEE